MAQRRKHLICVGAALCVLTLACSSESESIIAGDDDDVSDVAEPVDDSSSDSAVIGLDSPSDLLGTAWTVDTVAFQQCPTDGRIGLEDDPLEEQHLTASHRLSQITAGLPFVVWSSGAGGNLRHHQAGLGLGVRYQPTIDWLAANFEPTGLCLALPPVGYYEAPPTLVPWRIPDDFELRPDFTSILVVHDLDCEVGDWSRLLDPQVQYLVDEIRIGLPQLPPTFGQSSDGMCEFPDPYEVELTEAVAGGSIVPASAFG